MNQSNIKNILFNHCLNFIQFKQEKLQTSISDANESLGSAANSTAGDKHDTSRAMMHLEIEKKSKQIQDLTQLKRVLNLVKTTKPSSKIGLGSIVNTNQGVFYIAISAGICTIDSKKHTTISLASPLAQAIQKHKINEQFTFMNKNYLIHSFI